MPNKGGQDECGGFVVVASSAGVDLFYTENGLFSPYYEKAMMFPTEDAGDCIRRKLYYVHGRFMSWSVRAEPAEKYLPERKAQGDTDQQA